MAKQKKFVATAADPITVGLYHATTPQRLFGMFKLKRIALSTKAFEEGGPDEIHQGRKSRKFYLSLSRERNGGYAKREDSKVCIVFNDRALHARYQIRPVDYWGPNFKKAARESTDPSMRKQGEFQQESEDRLVTDSANLPFSSRLVKSIHVLAKGSSRRSAVITLQALAAIKERFGDQLADIPVFVYDNATQYHAMNIRKAQQLTTLDVNAVLKAERDHTGDNESVTLEYKESAYIERDIASLLTFVEQVREVLAGTRDRLPDLFAYEYDPMSASRNISIIAQNINTINPETAAPAREALQQLAGIMRRLKISKLSQLFLHLKESIDKAYTESSKKSPEDVTLEFVKKFVKENVLNIVTVLNDDESGFTIFSKLQDDDLNFTLVHAEVSGGSASVRMIPVPDNVFEEFDWIEEDDIEAMASDNGMEVSDFKAMGRRRGRDRAWLVSELANRFGYDNFDSYPRTMSELEARMRYMKGSDVFDGIDYDVVASKAPLVICKLFPEQARDFVETLSLDLKANGAGMSEQEARRSYMRKTLRIDVSKLSRQRSYASTQPIHQDIAQAHAGTASVYFVRVH